eukprot:COSAG02_NODE_361_length_23829_cov_82.704509_4_plen_1094_part_00
MASSEGSEEEHDNDVFEMELPPTSLASASPSDSRPPAFDPSKRRGSVIVLGGKESTISVAAEVAATIKRMQTANESDDINQMQAALNAAGSVAAKVTTGDPSYAEIQMMSMQLASRLANDESLRETGALRRSRAIREEIKRLWDLMVMESARIAAESTELVGAAAGQRPEVTRDGYREMHIRISRVLCDPSEGFTDARKALTLADKDWAGDITRFSGTAHIVVWLAAVREKFREASARAVSTHGFTALFKRYDADGSGELDEGEFAQAVRSDLAIDEATLSTKELKRLFRAVDVDGSGEVDAEEFTTWLFNSDRSEAKNLRLVKNKFRAASERTASDLGWQVIFDRYDDDNSGELDVQEFTNAVRTECELDEEAVSDDEIKELFGVIDTDQGGGIDAGELMELLEADLDQAAITFGGFYSSIFELAEIWAYDEDAEDLAVIEHNFVAFLRAVFKATAVPRDHVMHFSEAELETLDVFEDAAKTQPNFELRTLESVGTLVQADGKIDLRGDESAGHAPDDSENHAETSELQTKEGMGTDPETEVIEAAEGLEEMKEAVNTVDARNSNPALSSSTGTLDKNAEPNEVKQSSRFFVEDASPGQSYLGGKTRSGVLWEPVSPKVFALQDPDLPQNQNGGELAPAAARRRGCWVLPWQVRFAHRPAGALNAKRVGSDRATVGKPKVRVTRSKFLEQYNRTGDAQEIPLNRRRHGPLTKPQFSVSAQEYWAARRALLIDTGVRAATSAQIVSSKATRRQQQIAAVKRGQRNIAVRYGTKSITEVKAAAIARTQKEQLEKMVSPFSPRGRMVDLDGKFGEPQESSHLAQHRPKTAPERTSAYSVLARPETASESIERVSQQDVAHAETEHMSSGTKNATQQRKSASGRDRAAHTPQSARETQSISPRPSVFSPRSPVMQKTPRQIQFAHERRARAASSGVASKGPLSVATCRRGLDPMDIARGLTRPPATPPAPLFLPLSPRKFNGFAGTHLKQKTKKTKRRGRDSTTTSKARASSTEPSPDNINTANSAAAGGLNSAAQPVAAGDDDCSGGGVLPFSPQAPSSNYYDRRQSRGSPRPALTSGADLRCYSPASKFISLAV